MWPHLSQNRVNAVKWIGFFVSGLVLQGAMLAGAARAEEDFTFPDGVVEESAPEHVPGAGRLSADQLGRLHELKAWLAERKLERERAVIQSIRRVIPGVLPGVPFPKPPESRERQVLTPLGQRYSLGFQDRRTPPRSLPPSPYYGGMAGEGLRRNPFALPTANRPAAPPPGQAQIRWSSPKGAGAGLPENRGGSVGAAPPGDPDAED
jgi:hypothetical protein